LSAVFVPTAFITGISGAFYRQFALTIAGATAISLVVSLTLSPAMCALLLVPHGEHPRHWWDRPIRGFFAALNSGFDALTHAYGWMSARVVRIALFMLIVYTAVLAYGLNDVTGFGLIFTPVFYVACRRLADFGARRRPGLASRSREGA